MVTVSLQMEREIAKMYEAGVSLTQIRHRFKFTNDGPIYQALKAQGITPNRTFRGKRKTVNQVRLPPVPPPVETPAPEPVAPDPIEIELAPELVTETYKYRVTIVVSAVLDAPTFGEAAQKAASCPGTVEVLTVAKIG